MTSQDAPTARKVVPGDAARLGATPHDGGVNFAVSSTIADEVTLCLFDAATPRAIVYEAHVKGFTMRHPDIPPDIRGTYAGLAHEAATGYLRDLGVTAIELLPLHEYVPEGFLLGRGLPNYWGYNTIGYFAPHQGYASGESADQVTEFRDMVKALHRAGIESSSTWCTTTPRRATRTARRSASADWTTRPTTGSSTATNAATTTRQGPATR